MRSKRVIVHGVSFRGLSVVLLSLVSLLPAEAARAQAPRFLRGDVDGNGRLAITDPINLLGFLFLGGSPPPCTPVANVDGEGRVNIGDPVFLLTHLFLGGNAPPPLTLRETAECDPAAVERGMMVYQTNDPRGNFTSCATCHELIPDGQSPMVLSGHSLHDALRRPRFKAGMAARFLDATNVCRQDWMFTSKWTEATPEFQDMLLFLESMTPPDPAPSLSYQIDCDPKPGPAGNGETGCKVFNISCAVCHGASGVGTDTLAPSLVDLNSPLLDDASYLRLRIRRSGPSTLDRPDVVYPCLIGRTTMPFFTSDKLSDPQVEDIIAFVALARQEARAGRTTFLCPDPPPAGGTALRRGQFQNSRPNYGVSGFAEELDTRKIRLTGFNYFGNGILVQVWLFKQGNIAGGRAIGPDLRRATPYKDETVVVDIPAEVTSDMYDSVSIWCVAAKVNFADCLLAPVPPP